jgi:hypothetical protein
MYSDIKEVVFGIFPFSHDAKLILLGLLVWLISGLIFRLSMSRLSCMAPLIIITVCVEIADVMLLSQTPIQALSDFGFMVLPALVVVFFQHQGWART